LTDSASARVCTSRSVHCVDEPKTLCYALCEPICTPFTKAAPKRAGLGLRCDPVALTFVVPGRPLHFVDVLDLPTTSCCLDPLARMSLGSCRESS
jgi:hypothetical protein